MKQTIKEISVHRLPAFFTAMMMIAAFICGGLPPARVSAADVPPTVTITTDPASGIESFTDFKVKLDFVHNDYKPEDVSDISITVTGMNGMGGSYSDSVSPKSGYNKLIYTLDIPKGNLIYNGAGAATLVIDIKYSGKTTASYSIQKTVHSVIGGKDDPDEPTIPGPLDPPKIAGNAIIVKEGSPLQNIKAGEKKTLRIQLSNTTTSLLGKIQMTTTLPDGLSFNSADATKQVSLGRRENAELTLDVAADKAVKSGTQIITIKASYKYGREIKTEEIPVYIKVTGMDEQMGESIGSLAVVGYTINKKTVPAGETFSLNLKIQNNSNKVYTGTQVKLDGLATDGLTISGGLDTQYIPSLEKGAVANINYTMASSKKLETGNQILTVLLKSGETEVSSKVFVPIKGTKIKDDTDSGGVGSSKPQIIMQNYSFGDSSVTGGQTFTLTMDVKNTSAVTAIQNVKMTIESAPDETTGGVFTPANSSNTFFIPKVGAGSVFSKQIEMSVKPDAAPKSYGLQIKFNYEAVLDGKRESLEATETITVPVTQPDRFEVGEPEMPSPVFVGESNSLMLQYVNKGKSTVFNLSVEATGDFTTGETKTYIGNVETGAGDSYELIYTPTAEGPLKGSLKFTYEDANGVKKEILREFSTEVTQMPTNPDGENPDVIGPPPEEANGLPVWAWICIGIGVIVVGGVVVLIVRQKKKKKKSQLLEENDDFDDVPEDEDIKE